MANVDLKVPYAQKDAAKALGAWWSSERKTWFVPDGVLLAPFAEWLPAGAWLAQHDQAGSKKSRGRAKKKLSMSDGAIRSRAKKVAAKDVKSSDRATRRPDDVTGKITIGALYKEAVGAVGLPWAV